MLLLLLPLLASGAPSPGPCCSSKTVGGLLYTFVREDSSALSLSCLSPCVYERTGGAGGPHYCFTRGEQEVICGNSTWLGHQTGNHVFLKSILSAPKPGLYFEEFLLEGSNFTTCSSKLLCSSTNDSLVAKVLLDLEKDDETETSYTTEELCEKADDFAHEEVQNNPAGYPKALKVNVDGFCSNNSKPLPILVYPSVPSCPTYSSTKYFFCPKFKSAFNSTTNINQFAGQKYGGVPVLCCCKSPNFYDNNSINTKCTAIGLGHSGGISMTMNMTLTTAIVDIVQNIF